MTFAARQHVDPGSSGGGPFVPVTHQFTAVGTFTETIPTPAPGFAGPTSLYLEVGGPGGGGAYSPNLPATSGSGGSGALGSGTYALTSADWGKTFSVTISAGGGGGDPVVDFHGHAGVGPSIITNGTFSRALNIQAGPGQGGAWNPPAGGAGGVASGAQSNLSGHAGSTSAGGAAVAGRVISSGAGGKSSTVAGATASPGLPGAAAFAYS